MFDLSIRKRDDFTFLLLAPSYILKFSNMGIYLVLSETLK